MPKFTKGTPKPPNSGRKVGSKNIATLTLKEMILAALDEAGGTAYLLKQSEQNPGPFLALIGKVLPTTISGPNEGPIEVAHTVEERIARARQILAETFRELPLLGLKAE